MATPSRRFTTTTTGSDNQKPVALLAHAKIDTVIGAIIQLDGRKSYDPEGQPISFHWRFVQVPIGSEIVDSSLKDIRPNSSAVSFIPDKTGYYVVELVVNDGELDSLPITATVNIQLSRVPCGENIIPEAQFLWEYISDFWKLVEDREKITAIWSSAIQLIGAEIIKLWSNDYNKALSTIQPNFQRRWQEFSMVTNLTEFYDQRIIVGKTDSGTGGSSGNIGVTPGVGTTSIFYTPLGDVGDGDRTDFTNLLGNYGPKGRIIVVNDSSYVLERVVNQSYELHSGSDLVTSLGSNVVSSASSPFADAQEGDYVTIRSGLDVGSYKIKSIGGATTVTLVYPSDPPGGPLPFFQNGSSISFILARRFSLAVVNESAIPEGIVGASWRIPHLLHVPGSNFEEEGVRAGDLVVFDVVRSDLGLSAEIYAQIVGASGDRLGFEFTLGDLGSAENEGSDASIVESGGVVTISGLQNMRPTSVGGHIEVLNGDNPGTYKIRQYVSEDSVVISNLLASGADSGNPSIQWVERGKTGRDVDRTIFQRVVRELKLVPTSASDEDVDAAAGALISFIPPGINLSTRPFSKFGIVFKAKKVIHNSAIKVPTELVSAPVLQESIEDPPVVLRENLDYFIEAGYLTFVGGLFSLESPAPDRFWAECALYDNSAVIERNFGRLVDLSRDDLTQKRTRAPYLSAVKGLVFAYTNGPTVANMRLGLQILLGLPFAEEDGIILEVQENFSVDTAGTVLGRVLVEDLDENGGRTGFRRVYLYPTLVGLETNPVTTELYKAGDAISRFAPISKGVTVSDYVKDPLWWSRSLYGLEILKFFTFKVVVDSSVFDSNDAQFALEFIRAIKPTYVNIISAALLELSDDVVVTEALGIGSTLKFYDNPWGLEATARANDLNHQGSVLWNVGSYPFGTRTPQLLTDVETVNVSGDVHATSVTGWDVDYIRPRKHDATSGFPTFDEGRLPPQEGDILAILPGQAGSSSTTPGMYEIEEVIDANTLKLGWVACSVDPDQYVTAELAKTALDATAFQYGSGLACCILRRENPTVLWETDLVTDGTDIVQSSLAGFLRNHVRVGDFLCIEDGVNKGEYLIDSIVRGGSTAAVNTPVSGVSTIGGLSGMSPSSIGRELEFVGGLNAGIYRIVAYNSTYVVKVWHPSAVLETGVDWLEKPVAPYLEEDRVLLRNTDGSELALTSASGQRFRVVRPFLHKRRMERMRFYYSASPAGYIMEAGYGTAYGIGLSSEWRDVFTPGMVGLTVNVSDSNDPSNDGKFLITEYINSGRVKIDSVSTTSEPSPGGQKIDFLRAPYGRDFYGSLENPSPSDAEFFVMVSRPIINNKLQVTSSNTLQLHPSYAHIPYLFEGPADAATYKLGFEKGDKLRLIGAAGTEPNHDRELTFTDPSTITVLETMVTPDANYYDFIAFRRKP